MLPHFAPSWIPALSAMALTTLLMYVMKLYPQLHNTNTTPTTQVEDLYSLQIIW